MCSYWYDILVCPYVLWPFPNKSLSFLFSIPVISEEQARDALNEFVAAECCYGKGVLKDMVIRDIQSTSAYHVGTLVSSHQR